MHVCNIKLIVSGVNELAKYNNETDKKICDLTVVELLQKPNTCDQIKEVELLKTLIASQWAYKVSIQAGRNLNNNMK